MVGGQQLGHLTLIHQDPCRVYKCKLGQHNIPVSMSDKCQQQKKAELFVTGKALAC